MKVATVLGTRPEIIRLALVIEKLDAVCEHILIHTGQNTDLRLSGIFFEELGVREPDIMLEVQSAQTGTQIGRILDRSFAVLEEHKPDRLLVLGDTNSALSAVAAKRLRIPVFHAEAGNRCYDDRVPEEVNRRIVDHSSDILMPYTERSRQNLLREGIAGDRIFVTGNPIWEVIQMQLGKINSSDALSSLGVEPRRFVLATLHRAENVDGKERLLRLIQALDRTGETLDMPVILSVHPRTRDRLSALEEAPSARVRYVEPLCFSDFIALEKQAALVMTDSGTVQEECALLKVANLTLRDVTERPETVEFGSNLVVGSDPDQIVSAARHVTSGSRTWEAPPEYRRENVSDTIVNIVLGHYRQFYQEQRL